MAVGLREMTDTYTAGSATDLIDYFVTRLKEEGIPVVTPPGAGGAHIDACKFLPNLKHEGLSSRCIGCRYLYCVWGQEVWRGELFLLTVYQTVQK